MSFAENDLDLVPGLAEATPAQAESRKNAVARFGALLMATMVAVGLLLTWGVTTLPGALADDGELGPAEASLVAAQVAQAQADYLGWFSRDGVASYAGSLDELAPFLPEDFDLDAPVDITVTEASNGQGYRATVEDRSGTGHEVSHLRLEPTRV